MAITINKIAELCGVSRGTVDRALNNKGNVRPEVCERIKRVAAENGYRPNSAGRALARAQRPFRIGFILHSNTSAFIQIVGSHIMNTAEEMALLGTKVILRTISGIDPAEMIACIDDLVHNQKIEALAIMPLAYKSIQDKINELTDQLHIPVVTVNADLPGSHRLCYVGQENMIAGRTAAGIMGLIATNAGSKILPITGHTTGHLSYTERLFGFTNELQVQFPHLELLPVQNCYDDSDITESIVQKALHEHTDLAGIYMCSTGYDGIAKALIAAGMQTKVKVVVHDLVPQNLWYVRQQVYDFALGQDSAMQGSLPIKLLHEKLLNGISPTQQFYYTNVELRFHYNIKESELHGFTSCP